MSATETLHLECPRCLAIYEWDRKVKPNGPGKCSCKTFQPWKVILEGTPSRPKGFVRILTDNGWKELHPPHWNLEFDIISEADSTNSVKINKALKRK